MEYGNCIDVKDYNGIRTVFTNTQWKIKQTQRPELQEKSIIERIKKTVQEPSFVYSDLSDKTRSAYYMMEYRVNGRNRYLKVVIKKYKKYNFIITAYRPDYVKERGKTKCIYGKDND